MALAEKYREKGVNGLFLLFLQPLRGNQNIKKKLDNQNHFPFLLNLFKITQVKYIF